MPYIEKLNIMCVPTLFCTHVRTRTHCESLQEIEILLEDEAVSLKNMNAANPDGTLLHNIKNFVNDESKDAATFARSLKSHKKNAAMMFAAFCVQVLKESRDYAGEFNFLEEEEEAAVEEVEADLEEEDW